MKKKKEDSSSHLDEQSEERSTADVCPDCQEYKNGWKRALADYENLKNDLGKQKEEARRQIKNSFIYDLLPVMDNFAQAVAHAPKDLPKECETWMQGVTFIERQFADVLQGLGAEKIEVGDAFDPNVHESVGEGEEMKEVRSGWKMGEHVIRPAQVIVKSDEPND